MRSRPGIEPALRGHRGDRIPAADATAIPAPSALLFLGVGLLIARRAGWERSEAPALARRGTMTQGRSSTDRRALPELAEDAAAASSLRATFPVAFERCFGRVYAYVSRRTDDRISLERIVSQVLAANLDLLIDRHDEVEESCRLKRSADRLIAQESAQRTQSRVVGT